MKKAINPASPCILFILLLMVPSLHAGTPRPKKPEIHKPAGAPIARPLSKIFLEEADSLYNEIDLESYGLSHQAFEYALKGYTYLMEHHWLSKTDIISICDFSQSSRNKRMYVVDLEQKKVLINTYVAHGRRSGSEFARTFSNNRQSHKSSLGF